MSFQQQPIGKLRLMLEYALDGRSSLPKAKLYDGLIALLRSDAPLPESLRHKMADAFERGQELAFDNVAEAKGIRLVVEASDAYFKAAQSFERTMQRLREGLRIQEQHAAGQSYNAIYAEMYPQPDPQMAKQQGLRTRKLYEAFEDFVSSRTDPVLMEDWNSYFPDGTSNPLADNDFWPFAARRFADVRAWGVSSTADDETSAAD